MVCPNLLQDSIAEAFRGVDAVVHAAAAVVDGSDPEVK